MIKYLPLTFSTNSPFWPQQEVFVEYRPFSVPVNYIHEADIIENYSTFCQFNKIANITAFF